MLAGFHRCHIARFEQVVGVREAEPADVIDLWSDQNHRRPRPGSEWRQLKRMHHRRRRADVDGRESGSRDFVFRLQVARTRVYRDHGVHPPARDRYGKVVEHAAIDTEPPVDLARRIKPRQRARGVDGIGNAHIAQTWQSPHDLRAALNVDGVDEKRSLQLIEPLLRRHRFHHVSEWLLEVYRG